MRHLGTFIQILSCFAILLIPIKLSAQANCNGNNWVLPCNKSNSRFTTDYYDIPRPALSFRGFDNTAIDNEDFGYGLKQVLELYLSQDAKTVVVIDILKNRAEEDLLVPTGDHENKRAMVDANTQRLQAKALTPILRGANNFVAPLLPQIKKQRKIALNIIAISRC